MICARFTYSSSYRNVSNSKTANASKDKVDVTTRRVAYILGLMDQPTSPVAHSWVRHALERPAERRLARSSNRCSTGVSLSVATEKRSMVSCGFVSTLDFPTISCNHRCFPRDLYAVNNAGNVRECLPLSSSLVSGCGTIMKNSFPGCREVVPFLRNHLVNSRWCNYHWWFPPVKSSSSLCYARV